MTSTNDEIRTAVEAALRVVIDNEVLAPVRLRIGYIALPNAILTAFNQPANVGDKVGGVEITKSKRVPISLRYGVFRAAFEQGFRALLNQVEGDLGGKLVNEETPELKTRLVVALGPTQEWDTHKELITDERTGLVFETARHTSIDGFDTVDLRLTWGVAP